MSTAGTTESRKRTVGEQIAPLFETVRDVIADPAAHANDADVTILLRRDADAPTVLAMVARGLMALQQGQSVTFRYVD